MKKKGLQEKIERLEDAVAEDALDEDVEVHVQEFVQNFHKGLRIEKFSLKTAEEAKEALVLLDNLQRQLEAKQHTAQALRGLLEQKRQRIDWGDEM